MNGWDIIKAVGVITIVVFVLIDLAVVVSMRKGENKDD